MQQQQQLPTETQKNKKSQTNGILNELNKTEKAKNGNETKITQGLELNIINIINN